MRIKTKNLVSKKTIFIAAGIVVVLVAVLAVYVYAFKGTLLGWAPFAAETSDSINYDKPTEEQKEAGKDTKENAVAPSENEKPNSGSDQPPAPTPQPNGKSKVAISFTTPSASGQITPTSFQVRVLIAAIVNSGTCTLTFTKAGNDTVTKTAGVQASASTSTCQGFDVTLSPGTWQMALTFENEKLIGDASQTVTVQ